MSDANRIRVSIVPESTFGVTPAAPDWLVIATTGQSMRNRIGYQQSRTINNDRNVLDLVRLSKAAGGTIPMELTYSPNDEGLDRMIRAVMCQASWTTVYANGSCTLNGGTKTIDGSGFVANVQVGDIIRVSGAATASNNGFYKVSARTDILITVEADSNFIDDESCTVTRAARIYNGTATPSFSVEIARLDLQVAEVFSGCCINSMDLTVADESITTANFTFEGASSVSYSTNNGTDDEFGDANSYTDPTVHPILDSISVPEIRRGGLAYAAKSINMGLNNNVQPRTQIGSLGAQSMRFGEFSATGRVSAYLEDLTDIVSYRDNTATDLWLALIDANTRGYTIVFPRVKFGEAGADTRGSNQDDLNEMSVTAIKGTSPEVTAIIQRWV